MPDTLVALDPTHITAELARENLLAGDYDDENAFEGDALDIALAHLIDAHRFTDPDFPPSRKPGCAAAADSPGASEA